MATTSMVTSILFILPLLVFFVNATPKPTRFDITNYGCSSGYTSDISGALQKAWKDACSSKAPAVVVIPKGNWLLKQIALKGKCKSHINLHIQGTVNAPENPPFPKGDWITISYVDGLEIDGGGVLDGHGQKGWALNDCATNSKCQRNNPMNLVLTFITNLHVHDITSKDSKYFHVHCLSGKNTLFERLKVLAPGDSPNTDGIHLARTNNFTIIDTIIQTGDDCVSIGDDSTNVHITNTHCGPGHGISIGSLGKFSTEKDVNGIYVKNCTFDNTTNGVRIKTWPSSPIRLSVKNLRFEDLTMNNVQFPVIIDQEYCPSNMCNKKKPSLVKIRDVYINNIDGTSSHPDAVTFLCSKTTVCKNVTVGNIDIKYSGPEGDAAISKCSNVEYKTFGTQYPELCTKPCN